MLKTQQYIKNKMKKVIRYTAAWCGPCKLFAPTFNQVAAETPGV